MANDAKVNRRANWASDEDAGDLLAGILDETATAASAEQQRLADDLRGRELAELAAREAEEARKRESAEARLSAEADRQVQLQEKRTARLEAIKIEDLKARGEWVDPAILARKEREESARQAALRGTPPEEVAAPAAASEPAPAPVPAAPPAPARRGVGLWIAAAAALLVVGVGVAAAAGVGSYEEDSQTYLKVAARPIETSLDVRSTASIPLSVLDDDEALEKARAAAEAAQAKTPRKRTRKRVRKTPKENPNRIRGLGDLNGSVFDGL